MLLASLAALADLDPSHIAGAAGWTGTGLLGAVLYWIAFHYLPGMNKFIKELITQHAEQVVNLIDKHDANAKSERDHHQAAIDRVTEHCETELRAITEALTNELRGVSSRVDANQEENRELHKESRHHMTNIAHALKLKVATGDLSVKESPNISKDGGQ